MQVLAAKEQSFIVEVSDYELRVMIGGRSVRNYGGSPSVRNGFNSRLDHRWDKLLEILAGSDRLKKTAQALEGIAHAIKALDGSIPEPAEKQEK